MAVDLHQRNAMYASIQPQFHKLIYVVLQPLGSIHFLLLLGLLNWLLDENSSDTVSLGIYKGLFFIIILHFKLLTCCGLTSA
jgi:hypothetical protein